jgi:signal peptidase I
MTGEWVEWIANLNVRYVLLISAVLTLLRLGLTPWNTRTARLSDVRLSPLHSPRLYALNELVESAVLAFILVFLVIRPFIVQAFYIPSGSMRPTLLEGDRILVDKFTLRLREPIAGDILVFKAPPEADPREIEFIKRCVGVPGDVIEIRDGVLYRNGTPIREPYIASPPEYNLKIIGGHVYEINLYGQVMENNQIILDPHREAYIRESPSEKIPPGKLLMLGDNRNDSNDGHKWGLLDRNRVVGKAWILFWPPQRIRIVR